LQIFQNTLAKDERENSKIGLDVNGNAYSWIQMCPRFKIDKDGDRILTNTEVYLRVAERGNEYIHVADREPAAGSLREINCSLELSSWKMSIYQSITDAMNRELLLASQLVYINDPETKSFLSLHENDGTDEEQEGELANPDAEKLVTQEVALVPASDDHLDSNFLWLIESSQFLVGGPITSKTDTIRLKHFNSGLYLVQETIIEESEAGNNEKIFSFTVTEDRELPHSLFNVSEVNPSSKFLCNDRAIQIGHNGVWLERGESNFALTFQLQGTKEKDNALNLIFRRFKKGFGKEESEDESITNPAIRLKEPLDLYVGYSARQYLKKYFEMTEVPKELSVNTIWPHSGRTDIDVFKGIIEKLVVFTQGFPVSTVKVDSNVDKADMKIRKVRQNLLREQGILHLTVNFISKLIPIFDAADQHSAISGKKLDLDGSLLYKMANTVQSLCFAVVYAAVHENERNQMTAADSMPVLLANLSTQPLAVKCVTEMLSNNMDLQETKIGSREIQIFVDKLKASGLSTMYLRLLQACCSCQGNGVDGNQCNVAEMLFDEETKSFVFGISVDREQCRPVEWEIQDSLYLQDGADYCKMIKGYDLIQNGLPYLSLCWKSITDGQMLTVSIAELFRGEVNSHLVDSPSLLPKGIDEYTEEKAKMAQYIMAEMFLGAEMCLNRNYVAMHKLDNLFPYEVLVTILKMDVRNDIKAAAVRLLMCLHVDRDPQAGSTIPCLTRTWSDIKKNEEPQLPYVDANRRYAFGLIQQLISEHIKDMAGNKWDELSRHMLRMLFKLVKFNFYGSPDRIKDIIEPLIAILDRRGVAITVNASDSVSKPSKWISEKQNSYISEDHTFEDENKSRRSFRPGQNVETGFTELKQEESVSDLADDDSTLSSLSSPKAKTKRRTARNKYKRILEIMDSPWGDLIIMGLTLLILALDIYVIIFDHSLIDLSLYSIIEIAFLAVFAIELTVKLYCSYQVRGGIANFFRLVPPVNWIDFGVIVGTIVLYFISSAFDEGLCLLIGLRFFRIIKIFSFAKDAKIAFEEKAGESSESEKNVIRYSKAPVLELDTMVEAIHVLALLQKIIDDRNLSLFLRNFYLWESGNDRRDPTALFQQTIETSETLSLNQQDFEDVMLDCLMFSSTHLVQSVLEVLMAHFSMRSNILENAKSVQLLAASKREKQFHQIDKMLQQLEQNAETHELWGELATEEDRETNRHTQMILKELINFCRTRRTMLEFDEDYSAYKEIQDLYRNLGFFEISMKVMNLLDSVEPDENGEFNEVALNTRSLCILCNELNYWFFLGNAKNQELGYLRLKYFLDTLDGDINSHLTIRAIFSDNETLMRRLSHQHLTDLVDKIIKNGKSHHYLALFAAVTNDGERNIRENQLEIVKSLTSPGRLQKVACFFCPVDHPDYALKRELMEPFLNVDKDLSLEDLPPLLAYHLMFLEVLSGCTVGRSNMTTIEAKVQSVFHFTDILQSILDPGTILPCKIRLSKFFYNSVIEVELKIPGLDQSPYIWKLLESYGTVLGYAKDEIRTVEKLGWDGQDVSRQKIEYIIICIYIAGGFFARYFDPNTFRFSDGSSSGGGDKVQITQTRANELIVNLFYKIKDVYDLDTPKLSMEQKELIFSALQALNRSTSKIIVNNLLPNDDNKAELGNNKEPMTAEKKLLEKYHSFVDELSVNPEVMKQINDENVSFITILENLPKDNDPGDFDVRYESLIKKLVNHIRANIVVTEGRKTMDVSVTKTSTWIIRAFRTMIEKRMGMSIDERDEEGGLEQDVAAAPVVKALNQCGGTSLCLDLISDGIDEKLQLEAIKLGVALLFKEGGALEVQQIMNNHLRTSNSELFFKQVGLTFQKLQTWHNWHQIVILPDGEDPKPPEELLLVRFLQLMCEGHYLPNQDIMREQPNNLVSFNLLEEFVKYLGCLSRIPCRTSTVTAIRLAATILEVIQGPCEGNQVHFALNTELIETLNRLNRAKMVNDCVEDEEIELKKICIDIFQGLLEGQGEKSVVYERVLSVIHLDIIHMMSKGLSMAGDIVDGSESEEPSDNKISLQTECIVLLQMLCNFKPALYDELGISRNVEDIVGSGTAMIEIIWRGDIHRRFFHVPKVCSFLAKSSKDKLVEDVDRSNPENKLIDFLARSHDLYREVKHQQLLTDYRVAKIFSLKTQDYATWVTFILAIVINAMFIAFYELEDDGTPQIRDSKALIALNALNAMQSAVAVFVLLLNIVVRSPVIHEGYMAAGDNFVNAIIYTALDGKTLYYFLYLILSLLGLLLQNYYLPFLLLDIVAKNATTRDVLNAVVIPRKQLIMTVVLLLFINFIFAYFYVREPFMLFFFPFSFGNSLFPFSVVH
jgi:hypothetical protein